MKVVELGSVCEFENGDRGKNYPSRSDQVEEGVPFINAGCLKDMGIDTEKLNFITEERYNLLSSGKLKQDDILFCLRGSLGKFAVNKSGLKGAIASSLVLIRPKKGLDVDYLKNYFRSEQFQRLIEKADNSSSQPNLSATRVKKFPIPLPSLSEQKAIVAKLDRAQGLIDIDKEMLAKYDELIQSVFLKMFGNPVTNPKGWKVKTLKELGDIQTGKTPSTKVEEYFEGDIPFVTPSNLGENSISPTRFLSKDGLENSRKVRKGTTLVCCIGATIGKIGMTEKISGFNQQINSIEWNNEFVLDEVGYQGMRFFKDEIKSNAKSTTLPILKKSLFEGLKFPVFEKDLQENFVDMYYRIKLQKDKTNKSLKKSRELFSSLLQGAFG